MAVQACARPRRNAPAAGSLPIRRAPPPGQIGDWRLRALITLAQVIVLNRPNEIRVHLRGALRNGISKKELSELCQHSFLYCGGPASLDAFHVMKTALPELEAEFKVERKKR